MKRIAIAGYGLEGKVNYEYFTKKYPDCELVIADEKPSIDDLPKGAATILGPDAFSKLQNFDMVVRTASLAPSRINTNGMIWSATNEFFERCPAMIVGVTGTKGKGTTSSLIAAILHEAGKTVHLVGNIGRPALGGLDAIKADHIVVFELSSFQLWDLSKSPHIAVVLPIEADHLDIHADFDDYVAAKANITKHHQLDDVVIYHRDNKISVQIADSSPAQHKLQYPGSLSEEFVNALALPGQHNRENASAAIMAVHAAYNEITDGDIVAGLAAFTGLPHRLELVRQLDDVAYYNDSFSSAPAATVAAIRSFDSPEVLIVGGIDKGADFSELTEEIARSGHVKTLILIGEIRKKLAKQFAHVSAEVVVSEAQTMSEIVAEASSHASPGDIVILSPACASFDLFENFYDRGNQFREVVNTL